MTKILDPKNDIVFKLFFSKEKNKPLLISFLESVIMPPLPILNVTLLNPQITKNMVDEKASILDLIIELTDGAKLDVEMQMDTKPYFKKRILYYWAKLHQTQLKVGNEYQKLLPTISIAVLNYSEFKNFPDRAHSIFELKEKETNELYLPDLQLHFLELPKLEAWTKKPQVKYDSLRKWMHFLQINENREKCMNEISKDPLMNKAIDALEELSEEPSAQELAEMREKSRINLQLITQGAFEEGVEKGVEKGIEQGIEKGIKKGIEQGIEKGIEKGIKKGIEQGMEKGIEQNILKMAKKGLSASEIANLLDLELEKVDKILISKKID